VADPRFFSDRRAPLPPTLNGYSSRASGLLQRATADFPCARSYRRRGAIPVPTTLATVAGGDVIMAKRHLFAGREPFMHDSVEARLEVAAPEGRFAHPDSLRAVAALLVVWTHSAEIFAVLAGGSWWWNVARDYDFGRIGVVAFFGVSGFLVPKSIHPERRGAARTFLIRRGLRLYPAFWLSIPFGVLSVWRLFGRQISARDIAFNFTMIPTRLARRRSWASTGRWSTS
jgi:hypothetical protein